MFKHAFAVNVETGDMFLRITQNGEVLPALVALRCADKRQCGTCTLDAPLLFSFLCRSQRCHNISRLAQVKKIIRTVLHAYVVHLLFLVAERWVPGSVNS